jgi:hypothetical protein
MSTEIVLEDGRVLPVKDGAFDTIIEHAVEQLQQRDDCLAGLGKWLLDQRCEVQGVGVGYLDVRELSPVAAAQFRQACTSAYTQLLNKPNKLGWFSSLELLMRMWHSIDAGEPPDALTSPYHSIVKRAPGRRGPGWD